MKKFSLDRFAIILFFALSVFTAAIWVTWDPGYSSQVISLPPANKSFYTQGEIDTKVVVNFRYSKFNEIKQRILTRGTCQSYDSFYLEDAKFNRYPFFAHAKVAGWYKTGFASRSMIYEFPISEVPKASGTVTLKTSVSNCKNWKLPISVIVRK